VLETQIHGTRITEFEPSFHGDCALKAAGSHVIGRQGFHSVQPEDVSGEQPLLLGGEDGAGKEACNVEY